MNIEQIAIRSGTRSYPTPSEVPIDLPCQRFKPNPFSRESSATDFYSQSSSKYFFYGNVTVGVEVGNTANRNKSSLP